MHHYVVLLGFIRMAFRRILYIDWATVESQSQHSPRIVDYYYTNPSYLAHVRERWEAGLSDAPEMIEQMRRPKAAETTPSRHVQREQRCNCVIYRPTEW